MSEKFEFTTPVGRLVGGDPFVGRDKDFHGKPLETRDGNPRTDFIVQLALRKDDPAVQAFWSKVYQTGASAFPSLFSTGQAPPNFSFKMVDGDSRAPNRQGRIPAEREGYPGHYVFTFKTGYAPTVVDRNKMQVADPKALKRGDYIRIGGTCSGNGQQNNPGVYLNASMVQICGYGEEIRTGPTADDLFSDDIVLPAGASATPTAPSTPIPGGAPTPPTPPAGGAPIPVPPPVPTGAATAPSPTPAAPPAPGANGAAPAPMPVTVPGGPTVAPAPPAPAPAAGPKQTKPGSPYTYEQLSAEGWTEDQMRQHGYL